MLATIRHYLEMIRFSHTLFALPFALLAAAMAWSCPDASGNRISFSGWQLLGILVCMVGARSAAMAFNRLVDRDVDAKNPRTKMRHIPSGVLSAPAVAAFTTISVALFIAGTLMFWPNWLPLALSLPVLAVLLGYSLAKRFTSLAHAWLGVALMLAPVCVWIALRGETVLQKPSDILPALILGSAVLAWVTGFDIIYACQDAAFDREAGLFSIPAKLGVSNALRLAAVLHLMTVVLFLLIPWLSPQLPLGWLYYLTVIAVAVLLFYEHALVRPDDLQRINIAFFNVNAVISIGLFVMGTIDLFWV
jgi:4-hydroxybenzoate polyprenyltransferase